MLCPGTAWCCLQRQTLPHAPSSLLIFSVNAQRRWFSSDIFIHMHHGMLLTVPLHTPHCLVPAHCSTVPSSSLVCVLTHKSLDSTCEEESVLFSPPSLSIQGKIQGHSFSSKLRCDLTTLSENIVLNHIFTIKPLILFTG